MTAQRWVRLIDGGELPDKDLVGGKAWSIAHMRGLDLNVPPAFVITTEACREFLHTGAVPADLGDELATGVAWLQEKTGRYFGGPAPADETGAPPNVAESPLLLSVRSGAPISMPGMMDTILNLGIDARTETALALESGDEAFARDTHRRFLELYAAIVMKTPGVSLDPNAEPFKTFDNAQDAVLMMEVEQESRHVASHRQRTVLFLSAMRHCAEALMANGRRVHYRTLDDPENTHGLDTEVRAQITRLKPDRIRVTRPGDWRVQTMIDAWQSSTGIPVEVHEDTHFLTTPDQFNEWADGRKSLVMEYFYREQRRRLNILMEDDGTPVGGAWNFDADNRASFRSPPKTRRPYRPRPDDITRDVITMVTAQMPDLPGCMDAFHWPVTREAARRALSDFIEHRLPEFGTYQDAMWTGESSLYHSRLSAALNLKLLHPLECVDAAVDAWRDGHAPLNAVEGFVRQIIGWREFIRGVYWNQGPEYGFRNALQHDGALPDLYWTGETDMVCMREAVSGVVDESYGHHIHRLMITGNFALLAGVEPRAVNDWYLGMFTDGVDWVTVPNTVGMALYADGGVVGTKPYAASGKYIKRMSNYCGSCRYDVNARSGDSACPFNVLYWDFLMRHQDRFAGNHRMRMMLRNVERIDESERVEIRISAARIKDALGGEASRGI